MEEPRDIPPALISTIKAVTERCVTARAAYIATSIGYHYVSVCRETGRIIMGDTAVPREPYWSLMFEVLPNLWVDPDNPDIAQLLVPDYRVDVAAMCNIFDNGAISATYTSVPGEASTSLSRNYMTFRGRVRGMAVSVRLFSDRPLCKVIQVGYEIRGLSLEDAIMVTDRSKFSRYDIQHDVVDRLDTGYVELRPPDHILPGYEDLAGDDDFTAEYLETSIGTEIRYTDDQNEVRDIEYLSELMPPPASPLDSVPSIS